MFPPKEKKKQKYLITTSATIGSKVTFGCPLPSKFYEENCYI